MHQGNVISTAQRRASGNCTRCDGRGGSAAAPPESGLGRGWRGSRTPAPPESGYPRRWVPAGMVRFALNNERTSCFNLCHAITSAYPQISTKVDLFALGEPSAPRSSLGIGQRSYLIDDHS